MHCLFLYILKLHTFHIIITVFNIWIEKMFHYYTGFFICLYKIIFIINIFIILKCWTYKFQHFCLRINIKVLLFDLVLQHLDKWVIQHSSNICKMLQETRFNVLKKTLLQQLMRAQGRLTTFKQCFTSNLVSYYA